MVGTPIVENANSMAFMVSSLIVNNLAADTFAGVMRDDPAGFGVFALSKFGIAPLVLTGANTYTGGTTVTGGPLQLGDGTTSNGSVAGNITVNSTLIFANPNAQSYSGVISGSGSGHQDGPATAC